MYSIAHTTNQDSKTLTESFMSQILQLANSSCSLLRNCLQACYPQSVQSLDYFLIRVPQVWNRSMLAGKSTEIATKIEIEVPERYTHLNIDSQGRHASSMAHNQQICLGWLTEENTSVNWIIWIVGGNVSVATVNEASLRVRTGGGDLKLGKVKASKADCGLAGMISMQCSDAKHTTIC